MWVFSDTSILEYNYATMEQLFQIAPMVFLFLIPAVTMSSFAEEKASGTIEFLSTKPVTNVDIVLSKFFANYVLVLFALLPTLIYYYSIQQLGVPKGNLDNGEIIGSYTGLVLLAAAFVGIGLFASSISTNQVVAFVLGAFLCYLFHWAFTYIAKLPIFIGTIDDIIQRFGIDYHYDNISKGAIDSRDVIYFLSIVGLFIYLTIVSLQLRRG
jgi:ABC-2 type transport system permease protein